MREEINNWKAETYKKWRATDLAKECKPWEGAVHQYFVNEIIEPLLHQEIEKAVAEEKKSKDGAYHERNILVQALTKLFPAYLARHDENDESWEKDWMWIVYIDLPTGQVSWHIHDSERDLFNHLEVKENNWDGHNTERKYQRLQALSLLTKEK